MELRTASLVSEIDYVQQCFWKIPDQVYDEAKGLRHSTLRNIFSPRTPLDFWYHSNNPKKFESSALSFGTAVHLIVFQPDEFESRIIVAPECDRRTKAGKEEYAIFLEESNGKIVLSQKEFDDCYYIKQSIDNHPIGQLLAKKMGHAEISGFFPWHETLCKFRADYLIPERRVIFDLKTTLSGHSNAFRNSVLEYDYHTQAFFYLYAASHITGRDFSDFVWIVAEKSAPYKIYLYQPSKKWMEVAACVIDKAINSIEKCTSENFWPGPSTAIETLLEPTFFNTMEI